MKRIIAIMLWYGACGIFGWWLGSATMNYAMESEPDPQTYTEAEVIEIAEHAIKRQSVKIIEYCAESGMIYFDVDLDGKTDFVMACKVKSMNQG